MSTDIRQKITGLVSYLETNTDMLVIDADTHITDTANLHESFRARYLSEADYYHGKPVSAEDLIREMDMASVDMSLVWQNPATTFYNRSKEDNFESLLSANRYVFESSLKYPRRFIPAGWTDPKALGQSGALRMVEICVREFGCLLVKLNPAQNAFPIDSEPVFEMVDRIIGLGAIPAFHYGADTPYTPVSGLERLAGGYPDHPLVAVHMGGGGAGYRQAEDHYRRSRELGLKHPNVKFILSSRRDAHTESDLINFQLKGAPFCHNLFCASDAPYGRMSWNFGGYRWMMLGLMDHENHTDERVCRQPGLFTEEIMRNYLGANFSGFLADGYKKLLKKL